MPKNDIRTACSLATTNYIQRYRAPRGSINDRFSLNVGVADFVISLLEVLEHESSRNALRGATLHARAAAVMLKNGTDHLSTRRRTQDRLFH
jgi:hypothetical protein